MLTLPDRWVTFGDAYLRALDAAAEASGRDEKTSAGHWPEAERYAREGRTRNLAGWHEALLERLAGTESEDLLARLVRHPALEGPEKPFLQARLAHKRGDVLRARALATQCLETLPGHEGFRTFAESIGALIPARAQRR